MNNLHQVIYIARALNEHGIILNIDDMCMRLTYLVKFIDAFSIPISKSYPIQPSPQIKEQMEQQNITDFWTYYYLTIKQTYFGKKKERRWLPF